MYKLCLKCARYKDNKCDLECQGYKQYFADCSKEGLKVSQHEPIIAGIVACGVFINSNLNRL